MSFKDLAVWKKGIAFCKRVYLLAADFQKSEIYGLTSQIRRAAVSVSANIAEGKGRDSDKELSRYLTISFSSLNELITLFTIAQEVGYITIDQYMLIESEIVELQKMVSGLRKSCQAKN